MARISGIDLPKNKRGVIGLTYIYTELEEVLHKKYWQKLELTKVLKYKIGTMINLGK